MVSADGKDYDLALRQVGLSARTGCPLDALAQMDVIPRELVPEHLVLYLVHRCEYLRQWAAVREVLDFADTLSLSEKTRCLFAAKRAAYADNNTGHPGLEPVVNEGYEILATVFSGPRSSILKAQNVATGEFVAVKLTLDVGLSASALRTEAQILSRLDHPNVIGFRSFLQGERGACAIILEYVEGRTMKELLTGRTETISLASVTDVALALASGLEYVHSCGIVHHDIKPSNIMLDSKKRVKIIDFGVACVQDGDGQAQTTGGTGQYMAPESKHSCTSDHRADIYSFGLVVVDLLSLVKPEKAGSAKLPEWQRLHGHVCERLEHLARSCSRPDPKERLACMELAKREILEARKAMS